MTNAAGQSGITVVVTDPASSASCAIPTTTAAPASGSGTTTKPEKIVQVTITFSGTYDSSTMGITSNFANAVVTAMATSICDGGCDAAALTAQEDRITIISIAAGSIVVVSEIAPASGQTIDELDTLITSTLVADVNAGSVAITVDGVTYNATEISTEVTTPSGGLSDELLALIGLGIVIIILLAVGIPCFCCCVAVIVFFKCIKGKNDQPQGQQQGATQFV
jgi:hypothetical protein